MPVNQNFEGGSVIKSNPAKERLFLDLLQPYINLERKQDRHYSPVEYSLQRMDELAAAAGNPERELRIIHIAGTKGKSSTALILGAMLTASGHSCGIFTSPHLLSVRERFLVDQRPIPYELLIEETETLISKLRQRQLKANFFELMTVLSLRLFYCAGCRFAVVETGIGGLLDATNYIPSPLCTVITAISFDHTELLGRTIALIAAQKAGIIKTGVPVVVSPQPWVAEALPVIETEAGRKRAPLHYADPKICDSFSTAAGLPPVQKENFAAALTAVRIIATEPDRQKFTMPNLPGRIQCLRRQPLLIVDGAHNSDSARRLVESLNSLYPGTHFTVVLGVVKGKDCHGIMDQLRRLPQARFILTNPRPGKESALSCLRNTARKAGVDYLVLNQIDDIAQLPGEQNLLFTGSFYTAMIGAELFDL